MNINPQDILPTEDRISEEILISDYKVLTEKETIRIQKFFIKKLIEKISKWFTVLLSLLPKMKADTSFWPPLINFAYIYTLSVNFCLRAHIIFISEPAQPELLIPMSQE